MNELSDAEVFGTPSSQKGELSDAEVFGRPDEHSGFAAAAYGHNPIGIDKDTTDRILSAFGPGFSEAAGPVEQMGISEETADAMRKAGYFAGKDSSRLAEPFQAFFESIVRPGAAKMATVQGLFGGYKSSLQATGLPEDVVSILTGEPFAGSPDFAGVPHPPELVPPTPEVIPAPIRPVEGAPPQAIPQTRSQLAKTGIPEVDLVLQSQTTQMAIDNAVIDRSHTVPYMAGGSTPLEDPTVYIDKNVPKEQTAPSASSPVKQLFHGTNAETGDLSTEFGASRGDHPDEAGTVFLTSDKELAASFGRNIISKYVDLSNSASFDVAELTKDPEFLKDMRASWERIATRNEFLKNQAETPEGKARIESGWDNIVKKINKPNNKYGFVRYDGSITGAIIQRARAQGVDVAVVKNMAEGHGIPSDQYIVLNNKVISDEYKGPTVTFDPAEPWTVHENVEQHTMELLIKGGMSDEEAYRVAHFEFAEKAEQAWYRAHDIDQEVAEAEQQKWLPSIQHEDATDIPENLYAKPYPHTDVKDAKGESIEEPKPSPEEVARAMDIIRNAKDLQPVDTAAAMREARDMGIIGPPAKEEATPAAQAQRNIPPRGQNPNDEIKKTPTGEPIDAYQKRFEEWVSKIKAPGDIDNIISRLAEANNYFPEARAGDISPTHIDRLATSAGWESSKFDPAALRTRFQSDDEIRALEQVLLQTRDNYKEALAKVRESSTHENMEAAMDAQVRHEAALEYVAAFRADWGKAGNAQQEFLRREQRREQYAARSASGVPKDANDLIAAIEEFSHAATSEGLQRLITAIDKAMETKEELPSGVSELIGAAKEAMRNLCGEV